MAPVMGAIFIYSPPLNLRITNKRNVGRMSLLTLVLSHATGKIRFEDLIAHPIGASFPIFLATGSDYLLSVGETNI
jgi:hypothetical protein